MKAQGGACKTNNKEKREASSTGKLPGSSKNIHKQTTNTRAEVAGDDVSSGAIVVAVVVVVVSAAKMPTEKLTAL